jgi:hypothetical protein
MRGTSLCHAHGGIAVGRPSKLSDEVERRLCDALRAGNHLEVAAAYAGLSRSTLYRWLSLAREPEADPRLCRLADAVRKAEADAEVHCVGVLRRAAAQGDWRRSPTSSAATRSAGAAASRPPRSSGGASRPGASSTAPTPR